MKRKLRHIIKRKRKSHLADQVSQAQEGVPRITNETVAAHREEVLGSARKYIHGGRHTKHQIVVISTTLVITGTVALFSYCAFALYKLQTSSTFLYRVTQVIPFPIAKSGPRFVAYENYLFELRHYTHYYTQQQKLNFDTESGKQQLAEFKKRAIDKVVNDAYVKQLAAEHKVSVSNREVDDQIAIVRNQNRLGSSDKVFEDVLKDYWGWSVDDFKRSLRQQLLAQKISAVLDTETRTRAEAALNELKSGADFAAVTKKYSDDQVTKDTGGEFGSPIDRTNRDLPAQTTNALFKLAAGQHSEPVNIGYGLEIVRNIEVTGDKIRGAHILFNFKDINIFINDLKDKQKPRVYVSVK